MDRGQIIERERRWVKPAAFAGLASAALLIAAFAARAGIPAEDSSGSQLTAFDDHAGALTAYSILNSTSLLLMALPLLHLFRAAQARSPRVQGALMAFCVLGPLFMASQSIVNGISIKQVSSDFVEQEPSLESRSFPEFEANVRRDPESIDKVTLYTDSRGIDVELNDDGSYTSEYPADREDARVNHEEALIEQLDSQNVDHDEDSSGGAAGDALAEQITDDSSGVEFAGILYLPAALGMIVAMVYVPLQSVRTGLVTRFFGTLGMALGVSLILLPIAPLAIAMWFGWLGLVFLGRVPRGRPPAWDAGEAIPWPVPGDAPKDGDDGSIEGNATEITAGDDAVSPRAPKRKRKRRR